jgi:putative phage-type endonuclease
MAKMFEQGTEEWRFDRYGKITASRWIDALAKTKAGKPTAAREKYMLQLVFERTAGAPRHSTGGAATRWGQELEAFAREAYEIETGNIVTQSGFTVHPEYAWLGASPDGLVGDDGLIEIKCPMDECVHITTLLEGMPEDHMPQVQANISCHGRKWLDFISYDARQREGLRLYIQRIERDDEYIAKAIEELSEFNDEVNAKVRQLLEKAA